MKHGMFISSHKTRKGRKRLGNSASERMSCKKQHDLAKLIGTN